MVPQTIDEKEPRALWYGTMPTSRDIVRRVRRNRVEIAAGVLLGGLYDVCGLSALGSIDDLELHLVAFLQSLVALRNNAAVVNKNVGTTIASDEPKPFSVVEPLDRALQTRQREPPHT